MTNYGADFLSAAELSALPFRALGRDVLISKRVVLVNVENIAIGDHVRIDPDVVILATAPVDIGSYVHIATQVFLAGGGGIELNDFCGLSQGVKLYSMNDDYSGAFLTGPTVPAKYLGITRGRVVVGRHVIVGAGTVILPGVTIGDGSAVGALSLIRKDVEPWSMMVGAPARRIGSRRDDLLQLEHALRQESEG